MLTSGFGQKIAAKRSQDEISCCFSLLIFNFFPPASEKPISIEQSCWLGSTCLQLQDFLNVAVVDTGEKFSSNIQQKVNIRKCFIKHKNIKHSFSASKLFLKKSDFASTFKCELHSKSRFGPLHLLWLEHKRCFKLKACVS